MNNIWIMVDRINKERGMIEGRSILSGESVLATLPAHGVLSNESLSYRTSYLHGIDGVQAKNAQIVLSSKANPERDTDGILHVSTDYIQFLCQPEERNGKIRHQVRNGAIGLVVYGAGKNDQKQDVFRPLTSEVEIKRAVEATVHGPKNGRPPLNIVVREYGFDRLKNLKADSKFFANAFNDYKSIHGIVSRPNIKGVGIGSSFRLIDRQGQVQGVHHIYDSKVDQETSAKELFNKHRGAVANVYNTASRENLDIQVIPFMSYSIGKESCRTLARQLNNNPVLFSEFVKLATTPHAFAGIAQGTQVRQTPTGSKHMFATNNSFKFTEVLSLEGLSANKIDRRFISQFKPLERFISSEQSNQPNHSINENTNHVSQTTSAAENVVPFVPPPQKEPTRALSPEEQPRTPLTVAKELPRYMPNRSEANEEMPVAADSKRVGQVRNRINALLKQYSQPGLESRESKPEQNR